MSTTSAGEIHLSREVRNRKNRNRAKALARCAMASAVSTVAIAGVTRAATWNDPAAVTPTITGVGTTNFTSTTALKDGDVIRNGATAGAGLSANQNYYVVGVGATPSTTIKLSN